MPCFGTGAPNPYIGPWVEDLLTGVNVSGSLLIGYLFVLFFDRDTDNALWSAALFAGLIGGFTTFSTFSLDTMQMLQAGYYAKAMLNTTLSVSLCLGGVWLGMILAKVL